MEAKVPHPWEGLNCNIRVLGLTQPRIYLINIFSETCDSKVHSRLLGVTLAAMPMKFQNVVTFNSKTK